MFPNTVPAQLFVWVAQQSTTIITVCSSHVRVSEWINTLYLPECQRTPFWKQAQNMKFKWLQLDLNVRDMARTYSQMHRTNMYSEHSWIIWPVWPNGWVFVYELSGSRLESSCSHLNFRFRACLEQGVPWHSGNYKVWFHCEIPTWYDKNIQSNAPYR